MRELPCCGRDALRRQTAPRVLMSRRNQTMNGISCPPCEAIATVRDTGLCQAWRLLTHRVTSDKAWHNNPQPKPKLYLNCSCSLQDKYTLYSQTTLYILLYQIIYVNPFSAFCHLITQFDRKSPPHRNATIGIKPRTTAPLEKRRVLPGQDS